MWPISKTMLMLCTAFCCQALCLLMCVTHLTRAVNSDFIGSGFYTVGVNLCSTAPKIYVYVWVLMRACFQPKLCGNVSFQILEIRTMRMCFLVLHRVTYFGKVHCMLMFKSQIYKWNMLKLAKDFIYNTDIVMCINVNKHCQMGSHYALILKE